jgi:hypothetical protein
MLQQTAEKLLLESLRYDAETGLFLWTIDPKFGIKAGDIAGSRTKHGYIRISFKRRLYLAHRLAWLYVHGRWPVDQIDHINGVKSDNRILNLREATAIQNLQNQRRAQRNSQTGLLGVSRYPSRDKFVAVIRANGRQVFLGYFDTAEDAHARYKQAKADLHGIRL